MYALQALNACRTLFTGIALCTGRASRTAITFVTLRTLYALNTLRTLHALRALRTAHIYRRRDCTRRTCAKAHKAGCLVYLGDNRRTQIALHALISLVAFLALRTLRTDNAVNNRYAVYVLYRTLCKLHPAPLRQRTPARIEHNMTA